MAEALNDAYSTAFIRKREALSLRGIVMKNKRILRVQGLQKYNGIAMLRPYFIPNYRPVIRGCPFFLKSDSHLPKNDFICFNERPLKNDEKCFLFRFKSSFRSHNI